MSDILIYGAGGHAKGVIDVVERCHNYTIAGLVDTTDSAATSLMGYEIYDDIQVLSAKGIKHGIVALGDNVDRFRIVKDIRARYPDFSFVTAVHPSVQMARNTSVKEGTVIMAGCCIKPFTDIGRHCIVNSSSTIGHDVTIEDFASIGPGCTLGGHVAVGRFTAIGLGASVIQDIAIGDNSLVGAGSLVLKDVPENVVAYGMPCAVIRERKFGTQYLQKKVK